jgi:hypothetical protein
MRRVCPSEDIIRDLRDMAPGDLITWSKDAGAWQRDTSSKSRDDIYRAMVHGVMGRMDAERVIPQLHPLFLSGPLESWIAAFPACDIGQSPDDVLRGLMIADALLGVKAYRSAGELLRAMPGVAMGIANMDRVAVISGSYPSELDDLRHILFPKDPASHAIMAGIRSDRLRRSSSLESPLLQVKDIDWGIDGMAWADGHQQCVSCLGCQSVFHPRRPALSIHCDQVSAYIDLANAPLSDTVITSIMESVWQHVGDANSPHRKHFVSMFSSPWMIPTVKQMDHAIICARLGVVPGEGRGHSSRWMDAMRGNPMALSHQDIAELQATHRRSITSSHGVHDCLMTVMKAIDPCDRASWDHIVNLDQGGLLPLTNHHLRVMSQEHRMEVVHRAWKTLMKTDDRESINVLRFSSHPLLECVGARKPSGWGHDKESLHGVASGLLIMGFSREDIFLLMKVMVDHKRAPKHALDAAHHVDASLGIAESLRASWGETPWVDAWERAVQDGASSSVDGDLVSACHQWMVSTSPMSVADTMIAGSNHIPLMYAHGWIVGWVSTHGELAIRHMCGKGYPKTWAHMLGALRRSDRDGGSSVRACMHANAPLEIGCVPSYVMRSTRDHAWMADRSSCLQFLSHAPWNQTFIPAPMVHALSISHAYSSLPDISLGSRSGIHSIMTAWVNTADDHAPAWVGAHRCTRDACDGDAIRSAHEATLASRRDASWWPWIYRSQVVMCTPHVITPAIMAHPRHALTMILGESLSVHKAEYIVGLDVAKECMSEISRITSGWKDVRACSQSGIVACMHGVAHGIPGSLEVLRRVHASGFRGLDRVCPEAMLHPVMTMLALSTTMPAWPLVKQWSETDRQALDGAVDLVVRSDDAPLADRWCHDAPGHPMHDQHVLNLIWNGVPTSLITEDAIRRSDISTLHLLAEHGPSIEAALKPYEDQ